MSDSVPMAARDAAGTQEEKSGALAYPLFVRQLTLAATGCFLNSLVAGNARQAHAGRILEGVSPARRSKYGSAPYAECNREVEHEIRPTQHDHGRRSLAARRF